MSEVHKENGFLSNLKTLCTIKNTKTRKQKLFGLLSSELQPAGPKMAALILDYFCLNIIKFAHVAY